jgi:hypothetical protein
MAEQEMAPAPEAPLTTPIVVEIDRKRRKKRYSRGLRDLQTTNRGLTRASRRLVQAVDEGMTRYLKESNRSARKRRDGALRDYGLNVADAIGEGLREASGIAPDLARTFNTRGWRKSVRRSLKATARLNRRLFRLR